MLLIYRLIHFKDSIPDLDIGVEGRDKELVKHLVQLFYGSKSLNLLIESLQKFLYLKNGKKESSIDHVLLPIISSLINKNGGRIPFRIFWNTLKETIPGKEDEKKPNEYHTEDYGTIYRSTITGILSDTLGAETEHNRDGNILIFNPEVIEKLLQKDKTKIIVKKIVSDIQSNSEEEDSEEIKGRYTSDREGVKAVSAPDRGVNEIINVEKKSETQNPLAELNEGSNISANYQIDSVLVNEDQNIEEFRNSATPLSDAFTVLTPSHSIEEFNNPLISEDDFEVGYNYYPEIINNIDRYEHSDHWYCKNKDCKLKGDKWFMMKHPCNKNNINTKFPK